MPSISWLISISRWQKRALSVLFDIVGLVSIAVLAVYIRLGDFNIAIDNYLPAILILPLIAIPIFITRGLYRAIIRYIGYQFANTVLSTVSLVFLVWAAVIFMLDLSLPRSAIIIGWLLALFLISSSRLMARRMIFNVINHTPPISSRQKVLIFGAGSSGHQLYNALTRVPHIYVVGFIDDNKDLHKTEISTAKVFCRESVAKVIEKNQVTDVFLAIPSISHQQRKEIIEWLEPYPVKISTIPGIDEIVNGKISFSDIREVDIEDLLGRDPVPSDPDLLASCITNQVVIVTGAGGSIGSELCRQVIKQKPSTLILFDICEFALYRIEKELRNLEVKDTYSLISILGSVQDENKLNKVFTELKVNTVYHAAAYKHVPIVEQNIAEGIRNNTFGTYKTAKAAAECGVNNFVLISTDKAVRPTNVMGASKRLAEMSLQALQNENNHTRFSMVRFGNVLDSSGSVIPLFREQIANGGPVTVTHKEITRYFMTIPEAASLVIQAGSMGQGGDVFILDMGEPVKIDQLARRIINLSGLNEVDESGNGDIEIKYTGLRPGEKLYEELLIGDQPDGTAHPRIMKAQENFISLNDLNIAFAEIDESLENYDFHKTLEHLNTLVDGFKHESGVVDYLQKP